MHESEKKVKSLSHLTFSDPMDCSLQGSSIHGIYQARVLEWVAIAFSIRKLDPSYNIYKNLLKVDQIFKFKS